MPELQITQDPGRSLRNIQAAMAYPAKKHHADYEEYRHLAWLNDLSKNVPPDEILHLEIPAACIHEALNSADTFAEIEEKYHRHMNHGALAGEVLVLLCSLYASAPEKASGNTAVYLVEQFPEAKYTSKGRSPGRMDVEKYWKTHKTVSHLWAARNTFLRDGRDWVAELEAFLSLSEGFRLLGESITPKGSSGSALPPGKMWTPPAGMTVIPTDIVLPEPDQEILDLLKRRPKNYRS